MHHPVPHNLEAVAAEGQTKRHYRTLKSSFVRAKAWEEETSLNDNVAVLSSTCHVHYEGEMSVNLLGFIERRYVTLLGKCQKQWYFWLLVTIILRQSLEERHRAQ